MSALPSTSTRMLRAEVSSEVQRPGNQLSIGTTSTDSDAPLSAVNLAEAIDLAIKRAGLTHKQACAYMDLDQSQWSKQLKGQDNHQVSFQRLVRLPRAFWNEFLPLIGEPLDICVSSADIADLAMLRILTLMEEIGTYTLRLRSLRRTA
jgi:hypothetical protein